MGAGYQQTRTGINIWNLPVDVYTSQNQQAGGLVIADCPPTATVRTCIQQFLTTWQSQGVTTIRFFIGTAVPMDDPGPFFMPPNCQAGTWCGFWTAPNAIQGDYSHPWLYNYGSPTLSSSWRGNLALFFSDVKTYAPGMSISPTLGLDPGGPYLPSTVSDCSGAGTLMFYRWLPYGQETTTASSTTAQFDDGDGINTCYSAGSGNPYFWGWGPFEALVSGIASAASQTGVTIQELDILQEHNLYYFTVQARLIYDNAHNFGVLGYVRSVIGPQATFSGGATNTTQGFDCGSIYVDSAMLLFTSEITGAIGGLC